MRLPPASQTGALAVAALACAQALHARVYELQPQDAGESCSEAFEIVAGRLSPGDELILHDGVYSQSCQRAISVRGTPAAPIIIRAANPLGAILTRPDADRTRHNNIEFVDSEYLIVRGLVFSGGSTGVRFVGGHHITFERNEIRDTGNNALRANTGDTHAFRIRGNHLHDTGLNGAHAEGEGMYIGCHDGSCVAHGHLIEGNRIHDLRAGSRGGNDGIEIKPGSWGNTVRGNVIHDNRDGRAYPCIFVYGGGPQRNLVENNLMWNCGEGIRVVSDAIVRNNLVLSARESALVAAPHEAVDGVRDVSVVNNTLVGAPVCARLRWRRARDVVFSNNALYCEEGIGLALSGGSNRTLSLTANAVSGALRGARLDGTRLIEGGPATRAFVRIPDQAGAPPHDMTPAAGSILIDRGDADARHLPAQDQAGARRVQRGAPDIGALERPPRAIRRPPATR